MFGGPNTDPHKVFEPGSKLLVLGMVIQPLIGNPYNGYINPYFWVDDHPLLYGNNGSLDPSTFGRLGQVMIPSFRMRVLRHTQGSVTCSLCQSAVQLRSMQGLARFGEEKNKDGKTWHQPGTPNNQVKMDGHGETTISYIKIWFIIQLKQPFISGCLGFQDQEVIQATSPW